MMLRPGQSASSHLRQLADYMEADETAETLFLLVVAKTKSGTYYARCRDGLSKTNHYGFAVMTKQEAERAARAFRKFVPAVWRWFEQHYRRDKKGTR